MICTIFGGAGFIGSHLAEELIAAGCKVRIFDRPRNKNKNIGHILRNIDYFGGNFRNEKDYIQALRGSDIVFHLISSTLPANSNRNIEYDIESNVVSSVKLLELCVTEKVSKIVFVSSGGTVYGIPEKLPIDENHSTNPICSYGISKVIIEKYLHLYYHLYGLDYSILRVSNAFGERHNPESEQGVMGVWLHKALYKKPIEIWGDGSVVRDYVYVKDVAKALFLAAQKQTIEKIFNVGTGKGYSLNQLAEIMRNKLNIPLKIIFKSKRKCDVPVNILDVSRIQKNLKWKPSTNLEQGIKNTYDWLRKIA